MKLSISQIILTCCLALYVQAHNVLVPAHSRRCFFEDLNKGDEIAVTYQFGDRNPESYSQLYGDFILYGPQNNEVLATEKSSSHGDIKVTAPIKGKYQYCFSNGESIPTKDVTFNVHGVVYVDVDDENSNTLDSSVRKLSKLVREIKDEQGYIVIRERTHRNTAESTNDRVKWWSVFQVGVVVANSIFQIYYLKRFFEVTTFV
ncbi:similar to Saccharomyces cerevisiae YGL200C EMP24 Component of the p24 complex [Maudiozyma barnettii]|uniref:Similar to Saccharomyces cerevisiae YGL200C EMP24 Component of the p24 complex n=1 Tax=Maudiozyma barnettii TaxID=61262 RepID=A0A8H2VBV0_9SACH|nr:Emp24p [Kazachstania barnettii]CAB4252412.1 similar to Saccharomyces cerevisiae YGL200C EMP24 Component of the p24 complex [Kazachstania barnettii]CAD1779147.1 similar to Saccharomyces cerevisiae YGL200C EMP24 Component of the p24 complex [Kazachstania barnettii]